MPIGIAVCPDCGGKVTLYINYAGAEGECHSCGHYWISEATVLTRIIRVKEKKTCLNCNKEILYVNVKGDCFYLCPFCSWIVPKKLFSSYFQMCPQCDNVADKWSPPGKGFGYVWRCQSGHIFGGTYPEVIPCLCWSDQSAGKSQKQNEHGLWVSYCILCGSDLETPDEFTRKKILDDLQLKVRGLGKSRNEFLRGIWQRLFRGK